MTSTKGKTRTQIRAEARTREAKALDLRLLGYSYDRIARELGWTHRSAARKAVERALKAIPREAALQLRDIELERLDFAQRSIAKQLLAGNLGAIDRLIRIMDHRAKLLGLYEPQPDTGMAEVAAVLGAWLGKVREEDEALGGDLPDQEPEVLPGPLDHENSRQTSAGGV
ncbi:hypothetical protein [Microbacterium sp. CH1]|uniref:hypothetical protein n=1 Tax=Microbacterium sp. CH1 TaxID=1770208 RepID=UPI000786FACC|nr:hypothetical protein [Microbacterium sp. CH1]KYJ97044.1 hypothetical protein AUV07_04735 [Microbacterium sp. CH1]